MAVGPVLATLKDPALFRSRGAGQGRGTDPEAGWDRDQDWQWPSSQQTLKRSLQPERVHH